MSYADRYGPWGLVMGGSQGLGLALATELGRRGVNLVISGRRQPLLDEAAEQLRATTGVEVRTLVCDAGRSDVVGSIVAATDALEIGFIIYNCAAEHGGEFLQVSVEKHLDNIAVNCITPTLLIHELGGRMVGRGRGGVVICSSLAAMQGIYQWVTYGAAKAYEAQLGEGLWDEFSLHGVDACSFMIGTTYTPNFIEGQRQAGSVFAHGRVPKDAPPDMQLPQLPEEAAGNLFRQLDTRWLPLIFANPLDEARHEQLKHVDRATMIKRMCEMMRSGFRSSMDEAPA